MVKAVQLGTVDLAFITGAPLPNFVADVGVFNIPFVFRDANHAHAVLWPMPNFLLGDILKSWKGYTAREANKLLSRTGESFWQPEPFDHWIRNDDEKARICRYVVNNPVTARLCTTPAQWRWSSAWPGWADKT